MLFDNDGLEKDSECVAYALEGWANHIETGEMTLSHNDVISRLKTLKVVSTDPEDSGYSLTETNRLLDKLRTLSENQKAFVSRLRRMAKEAREKL